MESDWASRNLLIIRTLMERSAVYRHALAPIMGAVGLTGILAAALETLLQLSPRSFILFWMGVGMVCVLEAFFLIRRQAVQESEPFWSPPTRRVAQALMPAFFSGLMAGLIFLRFDLGPWLLAPIWMALYGCAIHATGFFMPRGFKLFGWGFVVMGCALGLTALSMPGKLTEANWAMGACFGGSHWAYAIYLYFTERGRKRA